MGTRKVHPVESDAIGIWRLNEALAADNLVDETGHGWTAVQTGSPAVTASEFGSARVFGVGKYTTIADAPGLHPNDFTIGAWIYFDGTTGSGSWQRVIFYDLTVPSTVDASVQIMISQSTKKVQGSIKTAAGYVITNSPAALSAGVHHLAITWDRSTLILYIDGVEVARAGGTGVCTFGPGPLWFGNDPNYPGTPEFLRGWIDDIGFYATAKIAAWVQWINGLCDNTAIGGKLAEVYAQ